MENQEETKPQTWAEKHGVELTVLLYAALFFAAYMGWLPEFMTRSWM